MASGPTGMLIATTHRISVVAVASGSDEGERAGAARPGAVGKDMAGIPSESVQPACSDVDPHHLHRQSELRGRLHLRGEALVRAWRPSSGHDGRFRGTTVGSGG